MSSSTSPIQPSADAPRNAPLRPGSVGRRKIERVVASEDGYGRKVSRDALSTEEPLEIVLASGAGRTSLATTMRTPGADFDLVAGFLLSEGIIDGPSDLIGMRYCAGLPGEGGGMPQLYNRVEFRLAGSAATVNERARRRYTSSSCGVCGIDSIESVLALQCPRVGEGPVLDPGVLLSLPAKLRAAQAQFDRTGGLHAAAQFDASGRLMCIREDVGRHNAMDKLIGASLLEGDLPLRGRLLLLSGRISFELVQKAARAGAAVVAAVSAPSTLAVELAERTGITLVGFLRENSFNIYAGGDRIAAAATEPAGV